MFDECLGTLFRHLNFVPFVNLPFNQIILLFIVNDFSKLFGHFHNQVDKILRNLDHQIIELNLKLVDESILLESFVLVDVSVEDRFGVLFTQELFHLVWCDDDRVRHVEWLLLVELKIVEFYLEFGLEVCLLVE